MPKLSLCSVRHQVSRLRSLDIVSSSASTSFSAFILLSFCYSVSTSPSPSVLPTILAENQLVLRSSHRLMCILVSPDLPLGGESAKVSKSIFASKLPILSPSVSAMTFASVSQRVDGCFCLFIAKCVGNTLPWCLIVPRKTHDQVCTQVSRPLSRIPC